MLWRIANRTRPAVKQLPDTVRMVTRDMSLVTKSEPTVMNNTMDATASRKPSLPPGLAGT